MLGAVFAAGAALCDDAGALERARERASAQASAGPTPYATFLAAVSFSADVLGLASAEPSWSGDAVERLVRAAAEVAGADEDEVRDAVCSRALRDPRLHELPPRLAAEAVLRLLHALAPVTGAGLWVLSGERRVELGLALGDVDATKRFRAAARRAVTAGAPAAREGVVAVPVLRWQRPAAALVLVVDARRRRVACGLAEEAAAALAVVLEREALLERSAERERALVEASERRLVRVGFDLHDGAIQDVLALAGDVQLLRSQLGQVVPDARARALTFGRLDDLHARLGGIESELREVTKTLSPPALARRPLDEALREQLATLGHRYGVQTRLTTAGDLSAPTASQRIALLRIVQEAVNNAHEHGRATSVRVTVRVERDGLHATVTDDGCGFDVERALVQAARRSRLGLVGIGERVRLLGGRFDIDSRPGGPTILSVAFPPWKPLAAASAPETEAPSPVGARARALEIA